MDWQNGWLKVEGMYLQALTFLSYVTTEILAHRARKLSTKLTKYTKF
jgi:hypothetical protein